MDVDWARFAQTVERYETLSPRDAQAFLDTLADEDGDLAAAVRSWSQRTEKARSFLQTSAPDHLRAAQPSLGEGERVGAWEIVQALGAGGMGEVYKAQRADGGFDQLVALKLARGTSATFAVRFERERQRLAALDHPAIARIVDGGESVDGSPYMTMEFVDGEPITQFATNRSLDRHKRLDLVGELCAALSHAHSRLILHCDIKPDNVLVNQEGTVRLIDFGVASLIGEEDEKSGALTLAFAAPEQLKGEPVSTATDIFAVGMLIHLLETGKIAQRRADGSILVDEAAIGDPDLAAIIAKATAADPQDRYSSAAGLGADLEALAAGFPVTARPASQATRLKKLVLRNKAAAIMSLAAVTAIIVGTAGMTAFALEARQEAEANRIAQEAGALQIELYETFGAGFAEFVASTDPQSQQGEALFALFEDLERQTTEFEKEDPQKALQNYVFLSEIYANSGRDRDASRIARKLASSPLELTYPHAFTLSGLVHLSEGSVETPQLLQWQDRLFDYFSEKPELNGFELAINRCVRARLSIAEKDQRACLNRVESYLAENDSDEYTVRSGNLTLQAYAASVALALGDADRGKRIAREALEFYENEDRPASVPEVVFWMHLSDFDQSKGDWASARENLVAGEKSVEGKPQFAFFEVSLNKERAETEIALEQFEAAEEFARRSHELASDIFGPDHYQARDAQVQIALSLAGQGQRDAALALIDELIAAEAASSNDPTTMEYYKESRAKIKGV